MSVFYNALRQDSIQRDPIYDALDALIGKGPPVKTYRSGLLWGLIVSFLLVAGILLIAYGGSNFRTAQTEITQTPVIRILGLLFSSPGALPSSEPTLSLKPASKAPQIVPPTR